MDNQDAFIEMLVELRQEMNMLSTGLERIGKTLDKYIEEQIKDQNQVLEIPEELALINKMWGKIRLKVRMQRFNEVLGKTKRYYDPSNPKLLIVAFTNFLGQSYVGNPEKIKELEEAIKEETKISVNVETVLNEDIPLRKGKVLLIE